MHEFNNEETDSRVSFANRQLNWKRNMTCHACGKHGHLQRNCWWKNNNRNYGGNSNRFQQYSKQDKDEVICHRCSGKGHFAKQCASKRTFPNRNIANVGQKKEKTQKKKVKCCIKCMIFYLRFG